MTTVSSSKSKYFVILTLSTTITLIIIISIVLLITNQYRQTPEQISSQLISETTTLSPEELHRLSAFKKFLNLPSNHPNPQPSMVMNKFMRSIYREIFDQKGLRRKKRHLTDPMDYIISLPNHSTRKTHLYFEYNSSLEHLAYAELIIPTQTKNWLKINVTQSIQSFPFTYNLLEENFSSSSFLILYFRQSIHRISSRDLSSFYDNQLITYPDDPSYCQVRPLRISFSELNWSSWIIEPSSYEMNLCTGICQTRSNMGTYFLIQNLLNQKYPKEIPAPCCKPKRFSSTMILYYDGPNLVLKRHENMRVVECGCSS